MDDKKTVSIELSTGQVEYLNAIVAKHGLPDHGKALRCLINFAREEKAEEDRIFAEVRCLDC